MEIEVHSELNDGILYEWRRFLGEAKHQHARQDPKFALVEQAKGNTPLYVMGRQRGEICALGIFSLQPSRIVPNTYSTATALSGPVCDDPETVVTFLKAVMQQPAFAKVGALSITPYWLGDDAIELSNRLAQAGWRVSEAEAFRQTGLIDLKPEPDVILAGFSKSARREVRRADRQGVEIHLVQQDSAAFEFLNSLNRLRKSRGLLHLPGKSFMASFTEIYQSGDMGALLAAYHDQKFIGGLLLHRSRWTAHTPHFTTEADQLRVLGNLRLAPLLWLEGMKWARRQGCEMLDVEGWQESPQPSDKKYNIYKYKGEYNPLPILRISEHIFPLNKFVHAMEQGPQKVRQIAKRFMSLSKEKFF